MQTERRVTANPQTKQIDLGCESADVYTVVRKIGPLLHLLISAPNMAYSTI